MSIAFISSLLFLSYPPPHTFSAGYLVLDNLLGNLSLEKTDSPSLISLWLFILGWDLVAFLHLIWHVNQYCQYENFVSEAIILRLYGCSFTVMCIRHYLTFCILVLAPFWDVLWGLNKFYLMMSELCSPLKKSQWHCFIGLWIFSFTFLLLLRYSVTHLRTF